MTRHDSTLTRLPNIQSEDYYVESNMKVLFRNRLAEEYKSVMNRSYTVGTRHRTEERHTRVPRSSSVDSDVAEFSINGAITRVFPHTRSCKVDITKASLSSSKCGSASSTGTLNRPWSNKLPSVNSCDSKRKCCQRPWTRTQIELHKYKEALKNG